MNSEQVTLYLLWFTAPAATLFPVLYMVYAPWQRSLVGRAIVISKIGLACLVDASLAYHFAGPNYPYRTQVVLGSFALIGVWTWLYLIALLREQVIRRHTRETHA